MTEVTSPHALLSLDAAVRCVAAEITPLACERVELGAALGRFLAVDVDAPLDLPPFRNSSMDGYAVRAADTPGRLAVLGESAAGTPYAAPLVPGAAVRISTGAAMPIGADAVAPVEVVIAVDGVIELAEPLAPDAFVRDRGSDIARGELLLRAQTRIGPAQIGAAAAAGLHALPCRRRPRVAILTTGSELRHAGEPLRAGEIYDANGPMLAAALALTGAEVTRLPVAEDTDIAHREALERALQHDVVISSGGVSVGDHDLVRRAGAELGVHERFWRIALRPGKPLSFGVRGETLVFGLPGNPVSTLVCFELFVAPALLALQGASECRPAFRSGTLATEVVRNPVRDDLIRVRAHRRAGVPLLEPLAGQQSHQIVVAARADGLARIPAGEGALAAGAEVDYLAIAAG